MRATRDGSARGALSDRLPAREGIPRAQWSVLCNDTFSIVASRSSGLATGRYQTGRK
jgi:hypothetical protein